MQAKEFYFLDDAAKFITEKTQEVFSADDLISSAIEGKLFLSISASNWQVEFYDKKIIFQFNDYCGIDTPTLKAAIHAFRNGNLKFFAPTIPVKTSDLQKYSIFNNNEYTALVPTSTQSCPFTISDLVLKHECLIDFISDIPVSIPSQEDEPTKASLNPNVFKKNKTGTWKIRFNNQEPFDMKPYNGFYNIHQLLMNPNKIISASDLQSISSPSAPLNKELSVSELINENLVLTNTVESSVLNIDDIALREYQKKITELEENIQNALELDNIEAASRFESDLVFILNVIQKETNFQGKPKKSKDAESKISDNITRNIKNAIKQLKAPSPELADYLTKYISTGKNYVYSPKSKIDWQFY